MARVPGGVDEFELAPAQGQAGPVGGFEHARGIDRADAAIQCLRGLLAVDGGGARDQPGRVAHVGSAARMDGQARLGQVLEQQARTPGVIQVDMGEHHPFDR